MGVQEVFLPVMARLEVEVAVLCSESFRGLAATLRPVKTMQTISAAGEEKQRKNINEFQHKPDFPFISLKHQIIGPLLLASRPIDADENTVPDLVGSRKVCSGFLDEEHPGDRV